MIKSEFIRGILLLFIEGSEQEALLRKQIDLLNDSDYDYTGVGLFVEFSYDEGISRFKTDIHRVLEGRDVRINSSQLEMEAGTVLFFEDGIIDTLEIFSYHGGYPKSELKDYELSQSWAPDAGKKIRFP